MRQGPALYFLIMTFLELQQQVAGMLSRSVDDFTYNTFDNLKQAINNAQTRAQRLVDFNLSLARGYLPLTDGSANWRTGMLNAVGGTSVNVKKLVSLTTDENYSQPVTMLRESDRERLRTGGGVYAFVVGETLYYMNSTDDSVGGLYTVYYQKLADLSADSDTNYLTENCHDWIVFQSMFELLHYMKEDERVQISAGILRDKWDSVLAWNASMEDEFDVSLD